MPDFQSLPGFRDFYPEELAVRSRIFAAWREAARRYGFEEYDGPPLEPLEMYVEKSGQEIVEQLYSFTDKGGREVSLRPEMTPTLARMAGARARGLPKPIRWFSLPQLFRYERTQRGRLREHFQWNVDIVGESDVAADAEVLCVALEALSILGLGADDVVARVNDRRLMERVVRHVFPGLEDPAPVYAAVDKLERESTDRIVERLSGQVGSAADPAADFLGFLEHGPDLAAFRERFGGLPGVSDALGPLESYTAQLADLGYGDWVRFDPRIVRGLAYYTGIVFEVFDRKGELRAVCGGGRYDDLLAAIGGEDLPALGFGMGDVVLGELLRDRGLLPDTAPAVDYYVVAISEDERSAARRLAARLRRTGRSVLYALRPAGVGKQFKEAGQRGARRTIVIGPDEVAEGVVVVREMATGEERRVPPDTVGAE